MAILECGFPPRDLANLAMVFTDKLVKVMSPYIRKIRYHPFNSMLCDGTLSKRVFNHYLAQDSLYLKDFALALNCTSKRLSTIEHQVFIKQLSIDATRTEVNLPQKYGLIHPYAFFHPKKSSVVSSYTKHLLTVSLLASPEVSLAALLPCFYIYSQLGIDMTANVQSANPYFYWIKSYSSERFLNANAGMLNILNEINENGFSCPEEEVINACLQSTRYELLFLDSFISNKNQYAVPRARNGNR